MVIASQVARQWEFWKEKYMLIIWDGKKWIHGKDYIKRFFFIGTMTFVILFLFYFLEFLKNGLCFLRQVTERKIIEFSYTHCPNTCTASPLINIPHQSSTFVTISEPALTHHNHTQAIIYIRVQSWCSFCGFRQMHMDIHPSL